YLFDRATGAPLFPLASRPYPASEVPGERAAPEQSLPTSPAAYARQLLTEDMLTSRTPEAHAWALAEFRKLRSAGQFLPFDSKAETVIFPGFDGGAEWGGQAFDPTSGLLYLNSNEMAWRASLAETQTGGTARRLYLAQCATCHGDDLHGS